MQTEEQIEALLRDTNVQLCFDTGHHVYGGGEPISFYEKHADRIPYIHIKDCDLVVKAKMDEEKWSFAKAVTEDIMVEPGKGSIDFAKLHKVMEEKNYDGWVVVEQDLFPVKSFDIPLPIAKRGREKFCFMKCEENVQIKAKEKQGKIPIKKALGALIKNQYFWAVLILWMMQNVIFCVTGTILSYYCKYIFHNSSWLYSALYLMETGILIAATFMSISSSNVWKKKHCSRRSRSCNGRIDVIFSSSGKSYLGYYELCNKGNWSCTIECCYFWIAWRCCRIRTVENTYSPGKSYFCGRFPWSKSWIGRCNSGYYKSFISSRLYKFGIKWN